MREIISQQPNLKSKSNQFQLFEKYSNFKILLSAYILIFLYILIINEKVLVLCEKLLLKFLSNLHVLRPPESEKTIFKKVSVCLSGVCGHANSQ